MLTRRSFLAFVSSLPLVGLLLGLPKSSLPVIRDRIDVEWWGAIGPRDVGRYTEFRAKLRYDDGPWQEVVIPMDETQIVELGINGRTGEKMAVDFSSSRVEVFGDVEFTFESKGYPVPHTPMWESFL